MYELKCLGPPVLEHDGAEVKFSRKKSLALLAYIAVTRRAESRDRLVALLWPERPATPALGYLRMSLSDINTACPDRILDADRQSVRLASEVALDVDVWKFRELVGGGVREQERSRLDEAIRLYRGGFLDGFSIGDSPAFDDWQRENAEALARSCEAALQTLIRACVTEGDTVEALAHAQRLVAMDELDERYHQVLMGLEALAGKPVAVELAYERCCRILKRELDAQPHEETRRLYDRLRSQAGLSAGERLVQEIVDGLLGAPVARAAPVRAPARATGPAVVVSAPSVHLPEVWWPNSIAVDGQGRIYFTEAESRQVVRLDDMEGRGARAFGSVGEGVGQFGAAAALWIDARGRIYIADPRLDRIVRVDDMDGSGWVSFGRTGVDKGCFNGPVGVCTDAHGRIYVAEYVNNRIARFDDMDGSGWTTLGGPEPGEGPGRFNLPHGIFVDPSGLIYVSVHPATVVRMDDMDGSGWVMVRPANLRLDGVRYTRGFTVDPDQYAIYLAVGDALNSVIRIAGLTGLRWTALTTRPGASRSHPKPRDNLKNPMRVCLDSRHRLYIADAANHRIVRVDDIYGNGWTEYPPPSPS